MKIRNDASMGADCGDFGNAADGVLTMAFINPQPFDSVYGLPDGFERGTLFPDLDKPFLAGGVK